jgi:hypothetical protein
MRVPQVSERIKEAPAQALRGVFAGIGQLLLITDKLRNKAPASQQVPQARPPEASETVPPAASVPADAPTPAEAAPAPVAPVSVAPAPAAPAPVAPVSAPTSEAAASVSAAPAPAAAAVDRDFDKTGNVRLLTSAEAVAGDTTPTSDATVAEVAATAVEVSTVAEVGAPLPNYDGLSIASLRARLRNLDVAQLRQLVGYERAHADRADVIAMFERRIAKLQAETTPEERGEAAAEAEVEAREDVEAEVQDEVGAEAEDEA